MAEVTPLLDSETCEVIKICLADGRPEQRRKAIKTFIKYLLDEDRRYCIVPNHPVYRRQAAIEEELQRLARNFDVPTLCGGGPRYVRHLGKIKTWNIEKGYGFIRQDLDVHDAFAHIRDFSCNLSGDIAIPEGTSVEYDLADGTEPDKPKALNILPFNWSPGG